MDEMAQLSPEEIRHEQESQARRLGKSYEEFLLDYNSGKLGRFGEPLDQSRGLRHDMSDAACQKRLRDRSSGL